MQLYFVSWFCAIESQKSVELESLAETRSIYMAQTSKLLTPESSNDPPRQLDFLSFGENAIEWGISRAA